MISFRIFKEICVKLNSLFRASEGPNFREMTTQSRFLSINLNFLISQIFAIFADLFIIVCLRFELRGHVDDKYGRAFITKIKTKVIFTF